MPDTQRSEVFLRLGSHSEKQNVIKTFRLFSGVLVGANLLESTPGATVSFALNVLGAKRAFAIDPMTYTFGMDLSYIKSETIDRAAGKKASKKFSLKRSFVKLAEEYGSPISDAVFNKDREVAPKDFERDTIGPFCESLYTYQAERMRTYFNADVQLQEFSPECPDPSFVFAPYFYIPYGHSGWREWRDLNLGLASTFAKLDGEIEKHGVICIDDSILDDEERWLRICKAFMDTGLPAFWLWLSALGEEKTNESRLKVLANSIEEFESAGRKVYNMHGGYLSALLSKKGLTGFSHGVGYGESKDVVPVIGVVVPTVNYHYPPLHIRTSIIDVERALSELGISDADDFHAKVCECTVCKGVIAGDLKNIRQFGEFVLKVGNVRESQTPDSAKKCRLHFLLARRKEIDHVSELTAADLKQELRDTADEYAALPGYLTLQAKGRHLKTWAKAL
jgi:hypothetical protein